MTPPSTTSESTQSAALVLANGKAGAAPPKVTEGGDLELTGLEDGPTTDKLPLHEDVMQLARLGEIGPIQKLFEEGRYSATYKDDEGITPLHVRRNWSLVHDT